MSSQKGNVSRTRAQKHKNRFVFKNDLHDKTPQQTRLNQMHVSTVCQRCKEVIEWKIKYKKYKPLSQAKTCTRCQQRTVKKAYHVICRDCAIQARCCAKCLKSADEVAIEAPGPTPQEEQQLQSEMDRLIKSFSERKRRAFMRFMAKGKQDEATEATVPENDDDEKALEAREKKRRVAHTREELLEKIKQLDLAAEDDDEASEDDSESDDYSDSEESSDEHDDGPKKVVAAK